MDPANYVNYYSQTAIAMLSNGPFAFPIWFALGVLILFFTRRKLVRFLYEWLGIEDDSFIKGLFAKIDAPLQYFLLTLASIPFLRVLKGEVNGDLQRAASFIAAALFFHVAIRSADYLFFSWYLGIKRAAIVPPIFRVVSLSIVYGAVILLLLNAFFKVDVLPLLATSTVITAVVGLALQDTLKNVFAGITVSLEKDLRQGDYVIVRPNLINELSGQIVEIGWRSTKILTKDNNVLIIPNSSFVQNELINFSRPDSKHRNTVTIPVPMETNFESFVATLKETLIKLDGVSEVSITISAIQKKYALYKVCYWIEKVSDKEAVESKVLSTLLAELSQISPSMTSRAKPT